MADIGRESEFVFTKAELERISRLVPYRSRGLASLEERVPGVCLEIERAIATHGRARILEVGCGFGTALIELSSRFGNMVELHGINRKSGDGDVSIMEWNAQRLGLPLCLRPRIHYADANVKLPFSSDHFDVIFSQVTYLYIVEKLNFLKEIGRILTREGVAKLDIGEVDSPNPRKNWIEIWMGGNLLPFQSLIDRTPGWTFERRGLHGHLVVRKPIRATYGDELVTTLPLPRLNREWVGVRSIYRWEPHTMALDASAVIFELAPVHEAGLSYEACLPRIEGRYQGFVTEDWQMEGCRTSSRRNVQALGEGRWCMEDTRLGTSIFLSATSGTVDDHVYRLVVPVKPVHF